MKSYYRLNHTRHIWSADIESPEKWEVNFIQIGCLPSTAEALEMGIAFVAWLQNQELVNLPVAEFSTIRQTSGMSGRRDFYSFVPGKTWYDVIPGTDIIRECVGKSKSVHLLHDSCNGAPNSGLSFSYDTFADLLYIYLLYFSYHRTEEDFDKEAMGIAASIIHNIQNPHINWVHIDCDNYPPSFIPVEDKGIIVNLPNGENYGHYNVALKFSPDLSFFIFNYKDHSNTETVLQEKICTSGCCEYEIPVYNGIHQAEWNEFSSLIEKKIGKRIYFKTNRYPGEDRSKFTLMASLEPFTFKTLKVGCQTVKWYPEEKIIIWKDYEILVDGKGIAFNQNDTDTVLQYLDTAQTILRQNGIKMGRTDEDGMVVFWFTTIPPFDNSPFLTEDEERQAIIDNL